MATIRAPRGVRLLTLAEQYNVRVTLIKHVRYNCKGMRRSND